MSNEQLTVLAREYAVKQSKSGAEFLSAGQGFQHGYYAGVEEMRAENAALRAALEKVLRIAERGDVNVQPLLDPIAQAARDALRINA